MNKSAQREVIDTAFTETLKRYQELRSGEFDASRQRDGDAALGKVLQTASIALRLELISHAEYDAYMCSVTT